MPGEMLDRRQHARVLVLIPATVVRADGRARDAHIRNLSLGGLLVECDEILDVGELCTVAFFAEGRAVLLDVTVVRVNALGAGVAIDRADMASLAELERIIASRLDPVAELRNARARADSLS